MSKTIPFYWLIAMKLFKNTIIPWYFYIYHGTFPKTLYYGMFLVSHILGGTLKFQINTSVYYYTLWYLRDTPINLQEHFAFMYKHGNVVLNGFHFPIPWYLHATPNYYYHGTIPKNMTLWYHGTKLSHNTQCFYTKIPCYNYCTL